MLAWASILSSIVARASDAAYASGVHQGQHRNPEHRAVVLCLGLCLNCEHCVVISPKGAIALSSPSDVFISDMELPDACISGSDLYDFLLLRRSSRWFGDEPVSQGILYMAIRQSPTARNIMDVEFTMVRDPWRNSSCYWQTY